MESLKPSESLSAAPSSTTTPKSSPMTIDEQTFEMTLEVLGWDGVGEPGSIQSIRSFFQDYDAETTRDLLKMREFLHKSDWQALRRLCHTWKGRNAQIGFRKCSVLAENFHEFLRVAAVEEAGRNLVLLKEQSTRFVEMIERECEAIRECLRLHQLLA